MNKYKTIVKILYVVSLVLITFISGYRGYLAYKSYANFEKLYQDEQQDEIGIAMNDKIHEIKSYFDQIESSLGVVSQIEEIRFAQDGCNEALQNALDNTDLHVSHFLRTDNSGNLMCNSLLESFEIEGYSDKVPFKKMLADPDHKAIFQIDFEKNKGTIDMYVHLPVYGKNNQLNGALSAKLDSDYFSSIISYFSNTNIGDYEYVFLVGPENIILSSSYGQALGKSLSSYLDEHIQYLLESSSSYSSKDNNSFVAVNELLINHSDPLRLFLILNIDQVSPSMYEIVQEEKSNAFYGILSTFISFFVGLVGITYLFNGLLQHEEERLKKISSQDKLLTSLSTSFESLFSGLPLPMVIVTTNGTIGNVIIANDNFKDLFPEFKDEFVGSNIFDVIRDDDFLVDSLKFNNGKSFFKSEWQDIKHKKFFSIMSFPAASDTAVVLLTDITKEKNNYDREASLQNLESEFLRLITHQLRTPINSISWTIEAAQEGDTFYVKNEEAKAILNAANFMQTLVNDFILLIEIIEKDLSLSISDFELIKNIENMIADLECKYSDKKVEVLKEIPKSIKITGDNEKVAKALFCVLENSFLYTKDTIGIKIIDSDNFIRMSIKDNGIGIAEDDIEDIFMPFNRGENAVLQDPNRNGIGLAIAKGVLHAHYGSIEIRSRLNEGTEVLITLPKAYHGVESKYNKSDKLESEGKR